MYVYNQALPLRDAHPPRVSQHEGPVRASEREREKERERERGRASERERQRGRERTERDRARRCVWVTQRQT